MTSIIPPPAHDLLFHLIPIGLGAVQFQMFEKFKFKKKFNIYITVTEQFNTMGQQTDWDIVLIYK